MATDYAYVPSPKKNYFSPFLARDRHAHNRAATQLELLFDLVVVIVIAASAHGLIHEFSEGHFVMGISKFLFVFLLCGGLVEQVENTPWHRHHIIEHFGLLNIMVLGEVLLSITLSPSPFSSLTCDLFINQAAKIMNVSLWLGFHFKAKQNRR